MWRISSLSLLLLVIGTHCNSYLELPLIRIESEDQHYTHSPIVCKNETTLNQDAEYKEICYEKDISYSIPFINNDQHVAMSVDLTIPISWIKSPDCRIEGSNKQCTRIIETFKEEIKETKRKIAKRFHKKSKGTEVENAIIEGSS
jgi:hypothetical protein